MKSAGPGGMRVEPAHDVTTFSRDVLIALCSIALAAVCGARTAAQGGPKGPDTAVMAGGAPGKVTLTHKAHAVQYGAKCESCHHPSKPGKALKTDHQKCGDCHTKAVSAPMKTKLQAAFHDPMAKKGTCVDCHVQANAKGKKAPVKCADCHRK